jgi:hypothetical protein
VTIVWCNSVAQEKGKYVRTCREDRTVDVEATYEGILDGIRVHKEASLHCPFLLCISSSHLGRIDKFYYDKSY